MYNFNLTFREHWCCTDRNQPCCTRGRYRPFVRSPWSTMDPTWPSPGISMTPPRISPLTNNTVEETPWLCLKKIWNLVVCSILLHINCQNSFISNLMWPEEIMITCHIHACGIGDIDIQDSKANCKKLNLLFKWSQHTHSRLWLHNYSFYKMPWSTYQMQASVGPFDCCRHL